MAMTLSERTAAARQSLLSKALLENKSASSPFLSQHKVQEEATTIDAKLKLNSSARNQKWNAEEQVLINTVSDQEEITKQKHGHISITTNDNNDSSYYHRR